jgi:hypothetical protein
MLKLFSEGRLVVNSKPDYQIKLCIVMRMLFVTCLLISCPGLATYNGRLYAARLRPKHLRYCLVWSCIFLASFSYAAVSLFISGDNDFGSSLLITDFCIAFFTAYWHIFKSRCDDFFSDTDEHPKIFSISNSLRKWCGSLRCLLRPRSRLQWFLTFF